MAEEAFELEYDGPAVADNELDARDFATAVLNAAELFHELNNLAYPGSSDLGVNIKAPTAGSFGVVLKILVDTEGMLYERLRPSYAANNLSALITTFRRACGLPSNDADLRLSNEWTLLLEHLA